MTTQLTFNNTHFNIIERDNQIWLTASDLAKALRYRSAKSVTTVYERNSDEFTPSMSLVINVMTNGINNSMRVNKTRVFSLRGAHLIAMFARTTMAKEFRKWVLDVLDCETQPVQIIPLTPYQTSIDACDHKWRQSTDNQTRTLRCLESHLIQLDKLTQATKELTKLALSEQGRQIDLVNHIQLYHELQNPRNK